MYVFQLSCVFPQIFKLCAQTLTIQATSDADELILSSEQIKKLCKKFVEPG
jgi:hypothetical protein